MGLLWNMPFTTEGIDSVNIWSISVNYSVWNLFHEYVGKLSYDSRPVTQSSAAVEFPTPQTHVTM